MINPNTANKVYEEGQAKYKAVCDELEQAHKEIEALKEEKMASYPYYKTDDYHNHIKKIEALKATVERMSERIWLTEYNYGLMQGAIHGRAEKWANDYVTKIKAGK